MTKGSALTPVSKQTTIGLTKGQIMYSIWIQVNPTTWVETRRRFVEEQHAREKARQYLDDLYDVRVFVQFDSEPNMQEVI